MKRSQKCFDLSSLEQESTDSASKRYRTDSEQSDLSTDSEISDMSDTFEKSVVLGTPPFGELMSRQGSAVLSLDSICCKFNFEPEEYAFGSSVKVKSSTMSRKGVGLSDQ